MPRPFGHPETPIFENLEVIDESLMQSELLQLPLAELVRVMPVEELLIQHHIEEGTQ